MKRFSFRAAVGLLLACLTLGLAPAPAAHAQSVVPALLGRVDPCPGASVCLNFTRGIYKAGGKVTPYLTALPGLTVSRAGPEAAECNGTVTWFAANQPAITSCGLGVWESRTNVFLWSQDLTNAIWTKGSSTTVTASADQAPDGSFTAQRVQLGAAQNTAYVHQSVAAPASQTHVESFYVRSRNGGNQKFALKLTQQSVADHFSADLTATPTWQKFTFSQAFGAGGTGQALAGITADAAGDAADLDVWQGDFNANASFITPPILTTSATATRPADNITLPVTIPAKGIVASGFLMPQLPNSSTVRNQLWSISEGGSSRLAARANDTAPTQPAFVVGDGTTVTTLNSPIGTFAAATLVRVAGAYDSTTAQMAWSVDGTPAVTAARQVAATLVGSQTLQLGESGGASQLDGYLQTFAIYGTYDQGALLQAISGTADASSLNLNFASGSYKTTTPYVRTNWLKNSVATNGAVVGVIGSGGSLPFPWGLGGGTMAGLTATVTGFGTDEGMPYVDLRFNGTTTSTNGEVVFAATTDIAASAGQTWTASLYAKMVGGSLTNISSTKVQVDGIGGSAGTGVSVFTLASTTQRPFSTYTLGTGATNVREGLFFSFAGTGVPVDVTIRLYRPQLEQTSYPTSAIDTTSGPVSVATSQSTNPADIGNLTFTNSTGGYAQYANGTLKWFPANTPRITDLGLLVEGSSTNKETNTNINPQSLSGVSKSGDSAATLTMVDDTAELAKIGLSGNVFKFDCSACTTNANVSISGTTGDTNAHTLSAYWRGSGTGRINTTTVASAFVALPAHYQRQALTQTPSSASDAWTLALSPGSVVYFIGNQLEEQSFASSLIPVNGASATRPADVVSLGGLSGLLTYPFTVGAEGTMFVANDGVRRSLAWLSDGTLNNRIVLSREASNGAGVAAIIAGGASQTVPALATGYTGAGAIRIAASFNSGSAAASVGGATANTSAPGSLPSMSQMNIGADTSNGSQWGGYISRVTLYPYAASGGELQYRSAGSW